MKTLLCINTGGKNGQDARRIRRLTEDLGVDCTYFDVDKAVPRGKTGREIWHLLKAQPWDLVFQEGTGIAGGLNLIRAARAWKQPYVVSSGDPIGGFFRTVKGPLVGGVFTVYERLLYRHSAGFVGWTPYLTGMAMKMGARRAVTVEGAVDLDLFEHYDAASRRRTKARYGLNPEHLVCGVVGSLTWTERQGYCYGLELIEMLQYLERRDVSVLIVGDGDGRARLEDRIPEAWRSNVVFTGRVPAHEVVPAMNAMDVGFITQTLDGLGRYRLTTKLPEYLACGLPVAMSPIPGFYDYARASGWALPPFHPASSDFHRGCAAWLDALTWADVQAKSGRARGLAEKFFDYHVVRPKFEAFMHELLAESGAEHGTQAGTTARAAHSMEPLHA